MKEYEDQYYLAGKKYTEDTLYLSALDKTENRDYDFDRMNYGDEPLFFENAYKDKDKERGLLRPIKQVHMNSTYLIVNDEIKAELEGFDIRGFQLYPAVIIDDNGVYHENFWFFNIYEELDALDCEKSEIRDYNPDNRGHEVVSYKLNKDLLVSIPEGKRLIFIMPNTETRVTIIHEKVMDIMVRHGVDNIAFHKMSEWSPGKQFRS